MRFRPILVSLVSGVIAVSAFAQNVRVIGAKLEADPKQYVGACPTTIKFHGSIESSGPGVVKYIFERSDGAIDTIVKSVTFTTAPYHIVIPDTTWTLGGAALPSYSGWERIKILSPNAGFLSNKAEFHIRCTGGNDNPSNPNNPTGTPNGKPDLIVTSFGFTGPTSAAGANVPLCQPQTPVYIFQVTVKNQGTAPSPSSASLGNKALVQAMAQDKPGWGNGAFLNALAPGASQTVSIPVYYLVSDPAFMVSGAPHPFLAIADPLGLVSESDETNNTKGPINMGAPAGCPKSPNG